LTNSEEVKALSGVRTKKEAVDKILKEYTRRKKAKKLLALEGKIALSFTLEEFNARRRKDVPHR
jgi:Arc/MetJ family transcription regulator